MTMQTGDLVLFVGHGPFDWFIRKWTRSAWAHCGVLWVCEGVPIVIESRYVGGSSVHALANRMDDQPTIVPSGRTLNLTAALAHLGDEYSVKDAVRAGLGECPTNAGWECAEWAAFCLDLDWNDKGWTPQNLVEFVTGR